VIIDRNDLSKLAGQSNVNAMQLFFILNLSHTGSTQKL
jgi:hypothetical protein